MVENTAVPTDTVEATIDDPVKPPTHPSDNVVTKGAINISVAFVTDTSEAEDKNQPQPMAVANKFQVLSEYENLDDLEVRSEGNYDEADGDVTTSKSDGELHKKKKNRPSKKEIPPSDRLTRSVAKKQNTLSNC